MLGGEQEGIVTPSDQAEWTEAFAKLREACDNLYAARVAGLDMHFIQSLSGLHRKALTDYRTTVERINAHRT